MSAPSTPEPDVRWLYSYAIEPTGRRFRIGQEHNRLLIYFEDGEIAGDVREECLVRSLLRSLSRAECDLREAADALRKLRGEVTGALGCAEQELRDALGNTNVHALILRRDEADALLARLEAGGEEEG